MRYALYFTPPMSEPLAQRAAQWLGRNAFSGMESTPPLIANLSAEEVVRYTAAPRRYGFHATLKAPFQLGDPDQEPELLAEIMHFAGGLSPFSLPPLQIARLGPFFALTPSAPSAALQDFADRVVTHFDRFRAAPGEAELARRSHGGLTPRELEYLHRWGYPYVLDSFRFHMTLTGPVDDGDADRVETALHALFGPLLDQPIEVAALALFVEPEAGAPFLVDFFIRSAKSSCGSRPPDRTLQGPKDRQTRMNAPAELLLKNATIVLADEMLTGNVLVRDGKIADIATGPSTAAGDDLDGDFLIPGLVELHTDHLEGHYAPRPKVRWNPMAAVLAHDAQVAASGITTVLDALRIGMDDEAEMDAEDMRKLADAIEAGVANDRLRADHYIHLRCEVSAPDCLDGFIRFEKDARVRLASLMDHAPGQRQFRHLDAYRVYYQGKMKMPEDVFNRFCERRVAQSEANAPGNRAAISRACAERGIVLASHDDATDAHVSEAIEQGVHVAEFPTTMEAAKASHGAGMAVLMGAPNIMRGGSHSGNVSARELAEAGVLDILSSDYIPFSMIQSAFHLGEVVESIALPEAIRMVSKTPAEAAGFSDRGEIRVGKRADLVRVRLDDGLPVVRTVWREGRRVI